jgi:2-C-methyl-D-erythritol 4-phosphate cytidylyltransferase/2-C-methyl-D-erythritol 2,4-cyclodiphosphate synthase
VWAVVPAAGRGARFDASQVNGPKQYSPLLGKTVIEWSLDALLRERRISGVVVALAADDLRWREIAARLPADRVQAAIGGATRQESVMNGLRALEGRAAASDWVLVHDAARPCLTAVDLAALIDAVESGDGAAASGAVLASPVVDTVKRERDGLVGETVDRSGLWRALTPQLFGFRDLQLALEDAVRSGAAVTDEAQAMERRGLSARLVGGSPFNIKVTKPEDLRMAETILKGAQQNRMRIGQGFDVHAFGVGDHVMLGGVRLEHTQGVVAHSDGDVVIHALCDAVLGALGMGDIGQHFPDTDPRHRGADSRVFLRQVAAHMREAGFKLVNADVTVLAEAPRIAKHRRAMAEILAADLGAAVDVINVKATTTEKLGFIGRREGLAASASVLLDAAFLG